MTRSKAFLLHLGISFLIFLILLYVTYYHWYPGFLFTDDGGWQGIQLMAGVMLVLGPLLTLVLFKPGKAGLKFDLWLIAIIQAAALCWGTWIIYTDRPYVIVFADYYFKPLTKYQYKMSKAPAELLDKSCSSTPCLIYSDLPKEADSLNKVLLKALQTATPLHMFGEYFRQFSPESINSIKNKNIDLASVLIKDVLTRKIPLDVQDRLIAYQKYSNRLMFFPVSCRYGEKIAVFNPASYQIIDTINLNLRRLK
ncbi:MAG: hypothetical protein P8Y24_00595 [Gammaproteobacteria bacterium]